MSFVRQRSENVARKRDVPGDASAVRASLAALVLALLGASGCRNNTLLDLAMLSASRPAPMTHPRLGAYEVLAGDTHCHLLPPDAPSHVSRELLETVRIAGEEHLDFVVLTPHVPSRFFLDPEKREWVRATQKVVQARIAAIDSNILLVAGMEYTDHRFGHVGLAFADVGEVLDEIAPDDLSAKPSLFFERWHARGGIAIINHPVLRPLPSAPLPELRADLSWRGFALPGRSLPLSLAPEIEWLSEHADAIETHNASIAHLRDQYFMSDPDWTLREGTHLVDREARGRHRRIAPVGGSDSHGLWLRPTTWVLASERSTSGVRDAIVAGRTCVRGPEGCLLEVRGADGAFHTVGASITTAPPQRYIEARVQSGAATYYVNGGIAALGAQGELVRISMPGRCALVRVAVGRSLSAPVYVDCPWASRPHMP